MIKAIFFDLDGTLLPIDEKEFNDIYFSLLYKKVAPLGYSKEELMDIAIKSIELMYNNDGKRTNKEIFWEHFKIVSNKDLKVSQKIFDDFYNNEFYNLKSVCKANPIAKDIVRFCKEKVGKVVLSTNPVFPKVGTLARMSFINLEENDFDYITTYENSSYCKPNPMYFSDLLNKFNLKPDEVLLFGNNILEDGECASSIGIKTYIVGDYVIPYNKAKNTYNHISINEIIDVIKKEMNI